ncbi:hypothetical protein [Atopobium sp. oral taxon 810]|uniref:5-methylcytosine restriction system specificity protein McrC n=1 Tax=Atopobium sp. oral taxon 810 TaxID=712158 RepID=UPI0003972A5B|nr:hypothetical protein [Atopobium sp. oral taxon 810]ERI04026.1 hypothetical protein HMPREF9069_01791 [Atopobium sp. oral taxon 810 str. F0209]
MHLVHGIRKTHLHEHVARVLRQAFEVEGELDEESVFHPERDGFTQTITEFSRQNEYNAVIVEAAHILSQSVSDFDLKARLIRAIQHLGKQSRLPAVPQRSVPSRFRNWQDLYSLCVDILDGYGIDYVTQGEVLSPGFVVRTSDAWEELFRQALVVGMKDCSVAFQEKHPFARRDNFTIRVRPDYIIRSNNGINLLVDAKYKYGDAAAGTIANADVYEGRAFIEATGIPKLVLLYPFGKITDGTFFEQFQHVTTDNWDIYGVRVDPSLLGSHGMSKFATELGMYLTQSFIY